MNEEEKKRLSESEVVGDESSEASSEVANESESQAETDNTQPTMSEPEPEAEETAVSEDENGDESVPEPEAEQQQPQQEPQPQQQQPMEKMLTQSQVNELVGRARQEGRESALKELYGRYGVSGDSELNDVFGRGQAYLTLDDDFKAEQSSNKALLAENALLKTKVDESRWEDIKAILGSKNMDITPENIEAEIPTHPEWRQTVSVQQQQAQAQPQQDSLQPQPQPQQAVLRKLGSESTAKNGGNGDDEESEKEQAMRLFVFNK